MAGTASLVYYNNTNFIVFCEIRIIFYLEYSMKFDFVLTTVTYKLVNSKIVINQITSA